ncbi:hypothetical protein RSX31_11730 [Rossellomorea sp. YC4-1]|nr:hypothetical protein [Rossellomorea sp. YC4-1]
MGKEELDLKLAQGQADVECVLDKHTYSNQDFGTGGTVTIEK